VSGEDEFAKMQSDQKGLARGQAWLASPPALELMDVRPCMLKCLCDDIPSTELLRRISFFDLSVVYSIPRYTRI
jgi:hypothetical protein